MHTVECSMYTAVYYIMP